MFAWRLDIIWKLCVGRSWSEWSVSFLLMISIRSSWSKLMISGLGRHLRCPLITRRCSRSSCSKTKSKKSRTKSSSSKSKRRRRGKNVSASKRTRTWSPSLCKVWICSCPAWPRTSEKHSCSTTKASSIWTVSSGVSPKSHHQRTPSCFHPRLHSRKPTRCTNLSGHSNHSSLSSRRRTLHARPPSPKSLVRNCWISKQWWARSMIRPSPRKQLRASNTTKYSRRSMRCKLIRHWKNSQRPEYSVRTRVKALLAGLN